MNETNEEERNKWMCCGGVDIKTGEVGMRMGLIGWSRID